MNEWKAFRMGEGQGDGCAAVPECHFEAEVKPSSECVMNDVDIKSCAKTQAEEVPVLPGLEPCTENPMTEDFEHIEVDPNVKSPAIDDRNAPLELHANSNKRETLSAEVYKSPAECVAKEVDINNELDPCARSLAQEASMDVELQRSDENLGKVALNDSCEFELADKKHRKIGLSNGELENGVKEVSNEDVFSEVSNPNFSPRDITSSIQTTNSHSLHNIAGGCGEVSSFSSRSSSEEESLSEGDHSGNNGSGEASTSRVVLEIPKHVSTTGIRKITFKFSKRKEDYEHTSSISDNQALPNEFHDGLHEVDAQYASVDDCMSGDMNSNMYGSLFHDFAPNRELKMSKKIVPDSYPTNVKKLLSTGILEGARVKYVSIHGEVSYTYCY